MPKRVLISVWDKTGIAEFASQLTKLGWKIISTGGTAKVLKEAKVKIIPIEKVTGNPEAFDGRMKTISFQIESALLFDRGNKKHLKEAKKLKIFPINMVVCNLYPFEKENTIKNIDIGGPTMVRAAAKNYKYVTVIIDPKDYQKVIKFLQNKGEVPEKTRLELAKKVFQRTAKYDKEIAEYFKNQT
ncbi:MAG: IMP cyclohydrolase [Candidatus Nealsonbacteria bacterium CG23_combo_of_CG06-09_8_20_14_all_39_25]|uniref:IMP cyclohydrolase n=4 Tax=Bacteria candidate phyla TaxID=1783234 RepID=A0A2G9YSB0_9BACT|nr:MAG: IMP cyclohydrolase [Candidatus Nealsonbacteria bacterium CG23_combo_of_CG06-09_8_20_14_all_39_25]PIQ98534.1 MAG: IMP cyclohydrolase [Candidatus Nealsonbacteria bacterium CG11_big_fil_rev_8_21_14_0_20_39_9]PIZ88196.1 MAG: IMP cyclohydrolase [Candidatus Nealsonbacteria bacterium CG_4_10_14_0_2_um_filter_39_15]PJC68782.1 MAG: IMP cyclohydrolase [candidate division WWE3 bacterium CG_4_8_14_3_um_filter_42_11]